MAPRIAIASMLRRPGPSLRSWVRFHKLVGFERIYLYFDDPDDPDVALVEGDPAVVATRCDASVRERWRALPKYPELEPFLHREVMARQQLNVALAIERATQEGLDWLLHIDVDELFFADGRAAPEVFADLEADGVNLARFVTREAVVDRDVVADPFRELRLFKENPDLFDVDGEERAAIINAAIATVPQYQKQFFLGHSRGKAAARLAVRPVPFGVHAFTCELDPDGEPGIYGDPCLLHYINATFEGFWAKYQMRQRFSDRWYDQFDIASSIGDFHLRARDTVLDAGRDAARRLYERQVMLTDPAALRRLEEAGAIVRIDAPAQLLEAHQD